MHLYKKEKGQYFTKSEIWLMPHILEFIQASKCDTVYDPFAGDGDLLKINKMYGINKLVGLDIDEKLGWMLNDSLINIPSVNNAIIITNPPYLTKYSASRKKISKALDKYFENSKYTDLYLIALEKMLEAQDYVVAIIPETFINSNFSHFNKLSSITIIEDNPFYDTETPVCVVCFDSINKSYSKIGVYKNDKYLFSLNDLEKKRLKANNMIDIKFNAINGWLGIRGVDTTNPNNKIKFDYKEHFDYDWNNKIKVSSRLLTLVDIDIPNKLRNELIKRCNERLEKLRQDTSDIVLSPFKGNMKNGIRRRRLDYYTARAILEEVYIDLMGNSLFDMFYRYNSK